jgi:hypothetical protein
MAVRKPQGWAIVGCIAAVCACLCLLILDGRALVKAQFGVAQREDAKLRNLVNVQANQIEKLLSDQMTGLRADANAQLTAIREGALKTEKDANDRTAEALTKIEEIRGDLKPVLDNAAAIEIHADTDLADARKATEHAVNPTEVAGFVRDSRFFIARAARAAGTVEQAGNDVDKALPALLDSAQALTDSSKSVGASVAGIADDAHKEADEFLKPKTFRQKVFDWLGMIPRVVKLVL